jgi:glycosyltransferase involved in cell wall biosynthesis
MRLSVIIPVYNEEQTIDEVIDRVAAVHLGAMEKEIVIANDGSTDRTRRIIDERGEERRWPAGATVHVYHSPINLGKGAAVRLGLAFATGDIMLVQDADLELDPAEYTRLLAPLLDGRADVVYGSRFLAPTARVPRKTQVANRFLTMLTNLLFGGQLTDMETAYKVMRREALDCIRLRSVGFDIEPELTARLLLARRRIVEVAISYNPRRVDEGKKMRWIDGVDAVYTLLKCRFTR